MTQTWGDDPRFKIEADSTEITDLCISTVVTRPENAISRCTLLASNTDGATFISKLDLFDILKVSARYGSDSWTKIFEGVIEDVGPVVPAPGFMCTALAYGYGRALRNTHCDTSFGKESQNPTLNEPHEIWEDLVDNYVNKSFGGAATGYAITKTYIHDLANPSINYVNAAYKSCLEMVNLICDLRQSVSPTSGPHWFVDPSKNLRIEVLGTDQTGWTKWWRTNEAGSTLTQGEDLLAFNFKKRSRVFANKIVLCSDLRKPGYDYWTNNQSGLWGSETAVLTDDADTKVVGSHSLKLEPSNAVDAAYMWYPSAKNAGWDFTKCGSEQTNPTLNLYARRNQDLGAGSMLSLFTSAGNRYYISVFNDQIDVSDEWVHLTYALGPYWNLRSRGEMRRYRWLTQGAPNWNNINWIEFVINSGSGNNDLWTDDLHFSGKIIREAYNSTSIASSKHEHQHIIYLDIAVNDSLTAATDTGTAAQLAYSSLLTMQTTPTVGTVTTPLIVDILPGQRVHIHADKQNGTYRIDDTFRVKEAISSSNERSYFTTLQLTNDLDTFRAKGPATQFSDLAKAVFTDPEAKNLKASGIDLLIPRLSKDYPS
jgi:hypothetical protein